MPTDTMEGHAAAEEQAVGEGGESQEDVQLLDVLDAYESVVDEGTVQALDNTVDEGQTAPPPRPRITVNAIPDTMNGKLPYTQAGSEPKEFHLRVPTGGFSLDVYQRPQGEWAGEVEVVSSSPLRLGNKLIPKDTDLVPLLSCGHAPDPVGWPDEALLHTRCMVPEGALDPAEAVAFTARFIGPDGTVGDGDTIVVEVAPMPPWLDPFPDTDVWLVVLSRDMFDQHVEITNDGTYKLVTKYVPEGNGVPDLDEALTLMGLFSQNQAFTAAVRQMFIERVREHAYRMFLLDASGQPTLDSPRLALYFEGDPLAPDQAKWSQGASFSMIALGGDSKPEDANMNYVGMALLDWNNQHKENDAQYGYGVFVSSTVRQAMAHPVGAVLLHEISPLDGTPLGMYPGDAKFLDPAFDSENSPDERLKLRHDIYKIIMDFATLALATTLCHEMGHSLGLVPNGPPPDGLFGGMDDLNFTESNPGSAHIDTPLLNVMQTGKVTNYLSVLNDYPRFNQLNMAYLRRRLVVGHL